MSHHPFGASRPFDYHGVSLFSILFASWRAQRRVECLLKTVLAVRGPRTFANTVAPLDEVWEQAIVAHGRSALLAEIHHRAAVRWVAHLGSGLLDRVRNRLLFDEPLRQVLRDYAASPEAATLDPEQSLFLARLLADFARVGQDLPPPARATLEQHAERVALLSSSFLHNLEQDKEDCQLAPGDLEGLPAEFLSRLSRGKIPLGRRLHLDPTEVLPYLAGARQRASRQQMEARLLNRAAEQNRPLLLEILARRRAAALLLGFPSWADYILAPKLAGTPAAVEAFLARLSETLAPLAAAEVAAATVLLEADGEGPPLHTWDWHYYAARGRAALGLDDETVAAYFPLERVLAGILEVAGLVFGLAFVEIPQARAWAPGVRLFEIREATSAEPLARFYVDLLLRRGKVEQAYAVPLAPGRAAAEGRPARLPVSALIAGLTRPRSGQPTLLQHAEVVTLFHEFGHVLHLSLARSHFMRFNIFEAEWESECVEMPSQVFEEWAWAPEALRRLSAHHRSGEPLPEELLVRLSAARHQDEGVRLLRQVYLATFDQLLHGPQAMTLEEADERANRRSGLPRHPGTSPGTSFGHLLAGYDAGYYGYLYAAAYGRDLFSRFQAAGVLDPATGADFRREILEPGWSRSMLHSFERFLGRPPSLESFLRARQTPGAGATD